MSTLPVDQVEAREGEGDAEDDQAQQHRGVRELRRNPTMRGFIDLEEREREERDFQEIGTLPSFITYQI